MQLVKPTATLVSHTPESLIAQTSRACYQSFEKQDEASDERLIRHFVKNCESPLEFSWACMDITCSYAAHVHLLRHRFFSFQWRSQRYDDTMEFVLPANNGMVSPFDVVYEEKYQADDEVFSALREKGAKKQDARYIVPQGVAVQGFMAGSARAWLQFLQLRTSPKAMPETRDIANQIKEELSQVWPITMQ